MKERDNSLYFSNKENATGKDRTELGRKLSKIENNLWNLRRFMEQ
jgi:hypothetical protein